MIPTPRPYQRDALDSIARELQAGVNRQLVQSPTGTGKTVAFAAMLEWPAIRAWLEQFPKRERHMLVLAHRKELLDQAAAKIQAANPDLIVTIDQADRRASVHSDVVVASIQTLQGSGFARLQRLMSRMSFRVVIVDEAHHAAARTYREALSLLGFLPPPAPESDDDVEALLGRQTSDLSQWDRTAPKDRLLVGFTATPNRSDAVGLSCVFQKIVFSYRLKQAIHDGWLVPITPWAIETDTSVDDVRTSRGDFVVSSLSETVNNDARNATALAAWTELAGPGVPTLGFTVDVAHAHSMTKTWTDAGYTARTISGETPADERAESLRLFTRGQVDAIFNCMVLTEGTDLPNVRCILHAKPTKSATLYEQMTGRGLRPLPGDPVGPERAGAASFKKPDCIVIDLVDVSRRHSLQTAPALYGLPVGLKPEEGQTLDELDKEFAELLDAFGGKGFNVDEQFAGGQHLTLAQLQARAELVDIWTVQPLPAAFGSGRALSWMKVDEDRFQMEYPWQAGYERLRVEKDLLDHWTVTLRTTRPKDLVSGVRAEPTELVIGSQILTAEDAAGLAEAFVLDQRRDVVQLRRVDAPWRQAPASEKQLAVLRRRRIPFQAGITKGQASDLLDLAAARQGRR